MLFHNLERLVANASACLLVLMPPWDALCPWHQIFHQIFLWIWTRRSYKFVSNKICILLGVFKASNGIISLRHCLLFGVHGRGDDALCCCFGQNGSMLILFRVLWQPDFGNKMICRVFKIYKKKIKKENSYHLLPCPFWFALACVSEQGGATSWCSKSQAKWQ